MSLFKLGNKYADIMEQLELAYAWEPEYVAGKPVDDDGNIISDVEGFRACMIAEVLGRLDVAAADFEASAGNIAAIIKNLAAEAEDLREQEKIFAERRRAKEKSAERLKSYLLQEMQNLGTPKIETVQAKISLRNNPESAQIADENALIEWALENDRDCLLIYKKPEISKTAVRLALKAGEKLPGAALGRTVSVIIK
jgi:hypothetical protein